MKLLVRATSKLEINQVILGENTRLHRIKQVCCCSLMEQVLLLHQLCLGAYRATHEIYICKFAFILPENLRSIDFTILVTLQIISPNVMLTMKGCVFISESVGKLFLLDFTTVCYPLFNR